MSFILDALNKSETERQRQRDPAAVVVPVAPPAKHVSPWPWLLATVLLANIALVLYLAWPEPDAPVQVAVTPPPADIVPLSTVAVTDGEVRALASEATRSTPTPAARTTSATPRVEPRNTVSRQAVQSQPRPDTGGAVPSLDELVLSGLLEPVELHVDVHVYHSDRRSRFVVLNSRRYREGDRISEGPMLESITTDGAIFVHDGHRFSITTDE